MYQLRDYQDAAERSLWEYFSRSTGNPLIAMPTGTGKSLVIAAFIRRALERYPRTRIMMLTHVQELIQQNFEKLLAYWPTAPAGIYCAGIGRRETHNLVTFAGIASVAKRPEEFATPDLFVIDEAHLVGTRNESMYRSFLSAMQERNSSVKCIGLSATCYRMGTGKLTGNGLFTDVCFDLTTMDGFNWLISQGYLCPLRAVRTEYRLDVSDVHLRGGQYVAGELERAVNKESITEQALREAVRIGEHRSKWLIFASGIDHAESIAEHLRTTYGIPTVAIHSKVKREERDKRFDDFKNGRIRCAVSMNAMTTGIDIPDLDFICVLRPTKSTPQWVQMLGRGTRPCPAAGKKDCLVGDFTNNTEELGPINDPLIPLPRKKGARRGPGMTAPVKVCPQCDSYVHASKKECPYCAYQFLSPLNISAQSSGLEVLRTDAPHVEEIPVTHLSYHVHKRRAKPNVLLVNYHCKGVGGGNIPRSFKDYVCLEHTGPARRYAERWWKERCSHIEPPSDVQRAVDLSAQLRAPRAVRVWTNKQRPEIVGYEYE